MKKILPLILFSSMSFFLSGCASSRKTVHTSTNSSTVDSAFVMSHDSIRSLSSVSSSAMAERVDSEANKFLMHDNQTEIETMTETVTETIDTATGKKIIQTIREVKRKSSSQSKLEGRTYRVVNDMVSSACVTKDSAETMSHITASRNFLKAVSGDSIITQKGKITDGVSVSIKRMFPVVLVVALFLILAYGDTKNKQ